MAGRPRAAGTLSRAMDRQHALPVRPQVRSGIVSAEAFHAADCRALFRWRLMAEKKVFLPTCFC